MNDTFPQATTVLEALATWAERTPEAPALLAPGCGMLDYRDLQRTVVGLAASLRGFGVGCGDVLLIVLPDGPALATMLLAAMTLGVAAPLPWQTTGHECARALAAGGVRAVVVPADHATPARRAAEDAGIPVFALSGLPSEGNRFRFDHVRGRPPVACDAPRPTDVALILLSSGTTGRPKRIPRTHENAAATAHAMVRARADSSADRNLNLAPMAFSQGINALFTTIVAGGSLVAVPGADLAALPGWVRAYRPTWLSTTTAVLRALAADTPTCSALRECRLRMVNAGGAGITTHDIETIEAAFEAPLLHSYGMSEASFISGERFDAVLRKPGSVGIPNYELRIVDEIGRELSPGDDGEIVVRGPNVFPGYLDDAEANAEAFLPGRWFRTGDMGRLDEDGVLFVTGRLKEMIKRGGFAIIPHEIEAVLLAHPAVADAAIFAVPDRLLDEDVVAAVVVRSGMSATPRRLRAWMLDQLAPSKLPRRIWFVPDLPRTETGKVRRGILADRYREVSDA